MAVSFQWRAHGGALPVVPFDQQLDKLALWIETWNHSQRCELIEKLLLHMDYEQYRFLWTVMRPTLHRDFMYSAQLVHPQVNFQPMSTHTSRKLREHLGRFKRNNFHRVRSAYCEFPQEVIEKNALPELTKLRKQSFEQQIHRKLRPNFSAKLELPKILPRSNTIMTIPTDDDQSNPLLR